MTDLLDKIFIFTIFAAGWMFLEIVSMSDIDIIRPWTWGKKAEIPKEEIVPAEPLISAELLGKRGRTISPLNLVGRIEIDGRQYEALSEFGYLAEKLEIEIVGIRMSQYLVGILRGAEDEKN